MTTTRRRFLLLTAAASAIAAAPASATMPWASDVRRAYDDILSERDALIVGNPRAEAVLIEFFDYQSPNCRDVHAALDGLVAEGAVRLICKEWPASGGAAALAARAAIAAHFQGRYAEAHAALMRQPAPLDEGAIFEALQVAGVDVNRVAMDLRDQLVPIERRLRMTNAQAKTLQLTAAPAFVAGRMLRVGAVGEGELRRLLKAVKAGPG